MEARYRKLGIISNDDPNLSFAVEGLRSGEITPNLPDFSLFVHATEKSRGNLQAALDIVHNAHEEEYYHTIDSLLTKGDWEQRSKYERDYHYTQYSNLKNFLIAREVVDLVEGIKVPSETKEAIHDLTDILRHYNPKEYGEKGDAELWSALQDVPKIRDAFVDEAVRQLAHFRNDGTNSEIGYLKALNKDLHTERTQFFRKLLSLLDENKLGTLLKARVDRVAAEVQKLKAIVP